MSEDIDAELLALARWNVMTRDEAERAYWPSPEAAKRSNEERDRQEWIEGIRRRLGLVTEVHRCRVWLCSCSRWGWSCRRPGCPEWHSCKFKSPDKAFGPALAHARLFVPQLPEPEPWTDLDVLAYEAAWDAVQDGHRRFAESLPGRMMAVTDQVNDALSGILPDGMRFDWE